jgi:hypothetical protein
MEIKMAIEKEEERWCAMDHTKAIVDRRVLTVNNGGRGHAPHHDG